MKKKGEGGPGAEMEEVEGELVKLDTTVIDLKPPTKKPRAPWAEPRKLERA